VRTAEIIRDMVEEIIDRPLEEVPARER
jgi:hypothetical protein